MRRTWLVLVAVVSLTACNTTLLGVTRGSGTMTSETREVSGFTEVALEGSGTVLIDVDGTESLTIEAEDNLMSYLTSDVSNGRLTLGTKGAISATREIVYTVSAAALDGVSIGGSGHIEAGDLSTDAFEAEISGSGTITLEGVDLDSFDASISGSGAIEVSGATGDLTVSIPGSGSFTGDMLEATTGRVQIDGSGNAVVNVSGTLDAEVNGSGSIEYLGSPQITSSVNGSGSIRAR